MKVLHIINNLGSGGAESMLINFFKELKNSDDYFEILLLTNDTIAYKNVPSHIKINTLSRSKKRYSIKKVIALYLYLKNNSFDIIHSHLFPSQYYLFLVKLALKKRIKIVTTEHNTTNTRRNYWASKQIDKIVYNKYDKIIFISEGVKNQFITDYPKQSKKGITINNGIPLDSFHPSIKAINNNKIIMVARFSEQKDHTTLLKAISLLNNHFTLSLVGEGPNFKKSKEFAKKLKIESNVDFLGFRNDIPELYREHSIFVLSSHWEGFGLVAVEAMASGLPVIASNVNGLKDVVKNTGLLFEKGNEKDLALKIKQIANNKELKNECIKKGREKAKLYDIKKLVKDTLELYKNI